MSDQKVAELFPKSNKSLVEHLEKLVEMAKEGDLTGMVALGVTNDGCIVDGFTGIEDNVFNAIAGLRILEHRIITGSVDMPEERNIYE